MTGRLRAMKSAFEQKVTSPMRRSITAQPGSLQLPTTTNEDDESSDVTPTRSSLTPTSEEPTTSSECNPSGRAAEAPSSSKGTLKKIRSRIKLSPRCSAQDDDDLDETLSESTAEEDELVEELFYRSLRDQDYEALADYLNDEEIDANEVTSEGKRYLHDCVVFEDQDACEIVLDAGGHINARDIFGWTALHFSAAFNMTEMTQYLLNRGADPRKKNKEGKIPEEMTEEPTVVQMLQIAKARRGLRSVSTVSISDIEAAQEEYKRRQEKRNQ